MTKLTIKRVEVYKGEDNDWRWRSIVANGEPIAASGVGYKSRAWALHMVRELFPGAPVEVENDDA